MLRACRLAAEFVAGLDRDGFLTDVKTQSAVIHQLLLLGEAAKRVTAPRRASLPGVPWRLVAGMRDVLIHEYDEVDLWEVWRTVEADVPRLTSALDPPEAG